MAVIDLCGGGVTKNTVQKMIDKAVFEAGTCTPETVQKQIDDSLENYPTKDEVPTKTSELENDSGFLTEHQSLDGYATEKWVEDKHYLTEHQSLTDYAKKSEVPTKTSQLTNDSGFLTQHQSLTDYAKKTDIPTKVSQLINDADYATKSDIRERIYFTNPYNQNLVLSKRRAYEQLYSHIVWDVKGGFSHLDNYCEIIWAGVNILAVYLDTETQNFEFETFDFSNCYNGELSNTWYVLSPNGTLTVREKHRITNQFID